MGRRATGKGDKDTSTVKFWLAPAQGFEVFRWFLGDRFLGDRTLLYTVGFKHFYGKRPHLLLWAGSRDPHGKLTVIIVHNCLSYCEIFYSIYTIYKCGCGLETHAVH